MLFSKLDVRPDLFVVFYYFSKRARYLWYSVLLLTKGKQVGSLKRPTPDVATLVVNRVTKVTISVRLKSIWSFFSYRRAGSSPARDKGRQSMVLKEHLSS